MFHLLIKIPLQYMEKKNNPYVITSWSELTGSAITHCKVKKYLLPTPYKVQQNLPPTFFLPFF